MKTKKEKLFSAYAKKWVKKTWLGWWKIDILYYSGYEFLKLDEHYSIDTVASVDTDWKYMTAKIKVNSEKLETLPKKEIEAVVVHELMHVLLNEMREEGIEHEERVATILARSFLLAEKHD